MAVMPARCRDALPAFFAGLAICSVIAAQAPQHGVCREVRANTTCASDQSSSTLALRDDGATAVAWVSRRQHAGHDTVCLQRYDSDGRAVGRELAVWRASAQQQRAPSIVYTEAVLWAAWSSFDRVEGRRCYLRRIEEGHVPIALGGAGARSPSLAAIGSQVIAVWVEEAVDGARVMLQRFAADEASPRGPIALSAGDEHAALPSIAVFPDGGAVVVWSVRDDGSGLAGLRARSLAPGGEIGGDSFVLAGAAGVGDIEPSIAASGAGGFAVAWMKATAGSGYDVWAATYDRSGEPLAQPRRVNVSAGELSGATVAAAPDGARLCVAWNAGRYDDGEFDVDVHARWLDAGGKPGGEPFVVTAHRAGHQRIVAASNRRSVAMGSRGELVVAWSGDGGLEDPKAAHLTWTVAAHSALAPRLAVAGPLTSAPTSVAEDTDSRPADVVHESTLAPHDPPIFTGVEAQMRGAENLLDGSGFEAITDTGWLPPDPHMAVGPEHVVAIVNGGVAFFKKDGTRTFFQSISGGSGFWGSVGASSFVFDPRVLFDPDSGRWLVMAAEHQGSSAGYFALAVSDDDDPNGVWYKYRWNLTSQIGTHFIDFPHIGVDARAVYISGNVFRGNTGHVLYVIDKAPLLTGQSTTPKVVKAAGMGSAAMGTQIGPSAAGYLVRAGYTSFTIWAITNAPANPQLVTASVPVPRFFGPATAPQKGTSVRLQAIDERLSTTAFINGRLYCVHSTDNPVRARWYEFLIGDWPNSGPPPILLQTGGVKAGESSTFLPSIQADSYGNVLVNCAKSSPLEYVSAAYFYRLAGDPHGTMRGPFVAKASPGSYTENSRWGDYSGASLDPRDRATFWFIHEWARGSRTWSTWVEAQRFQRPTLTSNVSTLSASSGGSVEFALDNPPYANRNYVLLVGASGMSPGFRLPSTPPIVNMDLNIDGVTIGLANSMGSPLFKNFMGTLDSNGQATALLTLPPAPFLAGLSLVFAYAQDAARWDFASETVAIAIR